jgi:hypothetical protein
VNGAVASRVRIALAAGFLFAAGVRVTWLCAFQDNWDMGTYRQFVAAAPHGGDLYRRAPYHYSPLWAFVLLGVSRSAFALCGHRYPTRIPSSIAMSVWTDKSLYSGRARRPFVSATSDVVVTRRPLPGCPLRRQRVHQA